MQAKRRTLIMRKLISHFGSTFNLKSFLAHNFKFIVMQLVLQQFFFPVFVYICKQPYKSFAGGCTILHCTYSFIPYGQRNIIQLVKYIGIGVPQQVFRYHLHREQIFYTQFISLVVCISFVKNFNHKYICQNKYLFTENRKTLRKHQHGL